MNKYFQETVYRIYIINLTILYLSQPLTFVWCQMQWLTIENIPGFYTLSQTFEIFFRSEFPGGAEFPGGQAGQAGQADTS